MYIHTYIVYLSETEGPHHSFRNKFRIYNISIGLKCTSESGLRSFTNLGLKNLDSIYGPAYPFKGTKYMPGHNTANWTCSKETFCKSINTILNWNLFSILKIEVATNAFFFRRFYAWLTWIFWDNSFFRVFLAVFSSFNISPKASLFPKLPVQSNDCRDAKKKRKEHRVSTEIHNTQEVLKGMIHFT